jgi:hypothetical protein
MASLAFYTVVDDGLRRNHRKSHHFDLKEGVETHTHTHTHTHMHIHTLTHVHTHTHMCTYTHSHTYTHIRTHTYVHTYVHTSPPQPLLPSFSSPATVSLGADMPSLTDALSEPAHLHRAAGATGRGRGTPLVCVYVCVCVCVWRSTTDAHLFPALLAPQSCIHAHPYTTQSSAYSTSAYKAVIATRLYALSTR